MLIFNELNTAFPWYDKLEKQNRYKEQGENVCEYRLISPSNSLLPFQFRRPKAPFPQVYWQILETNTGGLVADISSQLGAVKYKTLEGYDYFYFDGSALSLSLAVGFYYSVIIFSDGSTFYSETFFVPDNPFTVANSHTSRFLRLEWYNSKDLNPFYFGDKTLGVPYFKNICYLDTIITASEPEITTEADKNGLEELIPTFQRAIVPYTFTHLVPDFLKVALVLIPLHDYVLLTTPGGIHEGEIKNIKTKTSLEENGYLSTVDVSFEQELVVIKTGCDNDMQQDECVEPITAPVLTNVVNDGTNLTFTGTVPTTSNVWIEIYSSIDSGGPYVLNYTGKSPTQFVAGTLVVPNTPGRPWFKVKLRNFNCDYGFSNEDFV